MKGTQPLFTKLDTYAVFEQPQRNTANATDQVLRFERLDFNKFSVGYNDAFVLNDLNMQISAGRKYAVIGKNGSGKTTLIKSLCGAFKEYRGEIKLNGEVITGNRSLEEAEQRMIAIVEQDIFLFNDTIRFNIFLGKEYAKEKEEEILCRSGVEAFIGQIEGGLDYVIENYGSNMSGGQKQRIALARALAQERQILILDEGFSAIDDLTKNNIEKDLLSDENITLISVTHDCRDEHLAAYDEIIEVVEGKVKVRDKSAVMDVKKQ